MKTALQDLIDKLLIEKEDCQTEPYTAAVFDYCIKKAIELIELERKQIMDAYREGYKGGDFSSDGSQEYFDETYPTN